VQSKRNDPFPVIAYLNTERIRLATHLCKNMTGDIDSLQLQFEKHDIQGLLSAVEDLFLRLSGVNFTVEVEPERSLAAAASAGALTYPSENDADPPMRGIAAESELEMLHPVAETQHATAPAESAEESAEPARAIPPGSVDAPPQRRLG
jgi:hypothetical protein